MSNIMRVWHVCLKESVSGHAEMRFIANRFVANRSVLILGNLKKSSSSSLREPLVAGLQIFLGEEPAIAKEILEVGRDVAKRIEARREQMTSVALAAGA
jgi:hypothetical protein